MTVEDQLDALALGVQAFTGSVLALSEDEFMGTIGRWTPRDIVAHLIGWNRYVVRGAKQILRGELPFYDVEPGPDYANVNAVLIGDYGDTDRSVLLAQLGESTEELEAFLRQLAPGDWDRDFGVRHRGEQLSVASTAGGLVTVKSTVDDLIADYHHHRAQLDE